jgi:hypothetical protein
VQTCPVIPRRCDIKRIALRAADHEVADFPSGRADVEDLLHALYDPVLEEPVPARLLNLLPR